jgi:DNA invertase Pin-like site-specific DNA recombinase
VSKPKVVFYRRVSTRDQGQSGLGLGAQLSALQREAQHRGWKVVSDCHDVASGRSTNGRHGLSTALRMLERREADVLAVAKLDRLARSTVHFGQLLKIAQRQGWAVVALDLGVDTTTSNGRLVARILMDVAEWESERIGDRTRESMAEAKEKYGATFGNPSPLDPKTLRMIKRLRKQGLGARRIAAYLNQREVPTPSGNGKRWHLSQVQRVLDREEKRA